MSKTYEQVVAELDSKIPRDVVSQRDGGGGRKLSYLEGHYVIDRLNKVIGHGNWSYTANVEKLHSGVIQDKYGNDVHTVHYSAAVCLSVNFAPNSEGTVKQTMFTDYGYGDGTDKVNPGKAHELAIKEAITDGVKRCAKNLGMSMGLALYDKSQENVYDGEVDTKPKGRPSPVRDNQNTKPEGSQAPAQVSKNVDSRGSTEGAPGQAGAAADPAKLVELLARYIKVARAQKKSEETKAYFAKLGVTSPDDLSKLSLDQLVTSKSYLEELTK